MVVTPFRLHRYSFQEYLALEEVSAGKHEFFNGEVYALQSGSSGPGKTPITLANLMKSGYDARTWAS